MGLVITPLSAPRRFNPLAQPLEASQQLGGRELVWRFDGGDITSDGGVLVLKKLEARTGIGLDGGGGGGVGFGEDDNLIARHGLESFADVGMATVLVGGIPEVDALVEGGAEELGDPVVAQFTGLV